MLIISKAVREDAQILTDIKNCALDGELRKYLGRGGRTAEYDDVDAELRLMVEYEVYKIVLDGKIIGGFFMQWVNEGIVELEDLAIVPAYQRRGYGTQVLKMIEEMYPAVNEWRLSALAISVGSQHLYEKAGYRIAWRDEEEIQYIKQK